MKILLIGRSNISGGAERIKAYKNFLLSNSHSVHIIEFPGEKYSSKLWYYYQHALALLRGHEKRHMSKTADKIESIIKKERYEVVIGDDIFLSYVLTRKLSCLKIYSCEALASEELRFSGENADEERVNALREMEIEVMQESDCVIFPWNTTENYVRNHVWNGNNFITIKFGCHPQQKTASFSAPPSIVSMGNMGYYWSNRELLSYLTKKSPYRIDVYSPPNFRPPRKYHLNYRGFAPSMDMLTGYQFGLNTVSKDVFRRNHFSSRPLAYIAYGLPVLSPDWMQFSHELRGCIPYNEENFVEIIDTYSQEDRWKKLSAAAIEQAKELNWNKTLQPLKKIIAK